MNFPKASHALSELLDKLHKQNEVLGKARAEYLSLEAERKNFEATLVNACLGKSHAERVTNAQAAKEWLAFHQQLARSEAIYEFQKLKFSILEKEWQSQYLEMKLDGPLISKQS